MYVKIFITHYAAQKTHANLSHTRMKPILTFLTKDAAVDDTLLLILTTFLSITM